MNAADRPRRDARQDNPPGRAGSRVLRATGLALALGAMFLVGCFVIGPWLRRIQPAAEQAERYEPAPEPNAAATAPPMKPPPPAAPGARVSIAERTAPEPSPAEAASSPAEGSQANEAPTRSEAPPVAAPEEAGRDAVGGGQLFHVRSGLFADRAKADELATRLRAAGSAPSVQRVEGPGGTVYSVQIGAFRDPDNAEAAADKLRQAGFEAVVSRED